MTTKELINNYVHGAVEGRASSISIIYDECNDISYLYSYSTVIAKKHKDSIMLNRTKYSTTTSRQQNLLLNEATSFGLKITFYED